MTAVAYIRRSASEESPVSEALQRDTIAKLAAERGDTIARTFRDWGKSGGSNTRPEYVAMLAEVEAGSVGTIYAYDQDRLARRNATFAALLDLAEESGVEIVTPAGVLTNESARDFAELRGWMDGAELRKIRKRNKATSRMQDLRGDDRGEAPFGYEFAREDTDTIVKDKDGKDQNLGKRLYHRKTDPEGIAHVVETYERLSTFAATARALNAERFATQRQRALLRKAKVSTPDELDDEQRVRYERMTWHPVTVRDLIHREAPELAAGVRQGQRTRRRRPRLFAGLLRCHCGGPMTPSYGGTQRKRKDGTIVNLEGSGRYYCGRGALRGTHPKPHYIAEARIRSWIEAEADRLRIPGDIIERPGDIIDDSDDRRALAAMRERIGEDAYAAGIAALDAARAAQGEREAIREAIPPRIDWERESVEDINASLRAMWEYVELGPDLLPVKAEWLVPEWRA